MKSQLKGLNSSRKPCSPEWHSAVPQVANLPAIDSIHRPAQTSDQYSYENKLPAVVPPVRVADCSFERARSRTEGQVIQRQRPHRLGWESRVLVRSGRNDHG